MPIVIGYLVSAVVAVGVLWVVAGRNFAVVRDPAVNLADLGGRHVGLLSGLAGYAVTGMVLLVTLGRSLSDTSSTTYTTVVTMFFISWMAYAGTAFLFANIVDPEPRAANASPSGFDVPAAQFAGAAATLEFAFGLGWLALRPLFQAFGLERLADLAAMILVAVAIASYGLVAHHLNRSGYGSGRILIAIPTLTVVTAVVYGLIVTFLGLRSEEATLDLIIVGFVLGAIAFVILTTLTVTARLERTGRVLSRMGQYLILGYAQAVVLLVGFLVLSVLGLG